ncbi:polysaccharide deacetylase family protein [Psychrosphaera aestuarii]|uniref:polysaccharide deacetylase family protein n=1 Tax=Psychrosphaera aestuarii TaxID=1266052 RepID=UPI001B32ADDC|nr:polysaccharide deacetylase family protein [Psychrosphaera aestuarii]
MKHLLLKPIGFTLFLTALLSSLWHQKVTAATVVLYHHVSESTPKSTSVSPEQFEAHLTMIEELGLEVVPLTTIVNAIKLQQPVNKNWIAITFDDGFRNVYDTAFPMLKKRNWPFTVFVNPLMVKPSKLYMDWSQLKTLTEHGVDIMNHTLEHENLVQDGLSLQQIETNLLVAEEMIKEQLGQNHKMVAYPFGEYSDQIKGVLNKLGFVGFAQHSGAVGNNSDLLALTRFPANGIYANPKTLKAKLKSLAFDIESQTPTETLISNIDNIPEQQGPLWQVKLANKDFYQSQLACFITGQSGAVKPTWKSELEFEIAAPKTLQTGRVKYNCTAPSINNSGRFYWMSKLWITLPDDMATNVKSKYETEN